MRCEDCEREVDDDFCLTCYVRRTRLEDIAPLALMAVAAVAMLALMVFDLIRLIAEI